MEAILEEKAARSPAFVPGEALVKFKPEVPADRIATLMAKMEVEVIRTFATPRLYHVRIVGNRPVEAIVQAFLLREEVEYAEPNYIKKSLDTKP